MMVSRCFYAFIILLIFGLIDLEVAIAEEAVLAADGQPMIQIVLAANATKRQKTIADELAVYLKRISGAAFDVVVGDGAKGIVIGTLEQFPMPEWKDALAVRGSNGREAYGIRTEAGRVLILGATDLGLDHGVTKLLETLGCRWFFPNSAWRITPKKKRLVVDLDLTDRPALLSRVIWYGWGHWDKQVREDRSEWMRRNWMGESLKVYCSHAWQRIIRENKKVFEEHPEYLALRITKDRDSGEVLKKERGGQKFCISNPDLVELCKKYALDYFAKNPDADMVSMEPSDGGGHCECDECVKMGPIPERVHYLVNEVAKAVAGKYPGKYVGAYAYSSHSEPPSFKMVPNAYVQITAGFTRGRYTFLELIEEWQKHVSQLGIYEYLNVWAWTRDMPGAARGANVEYLRERIPYYIAHGATTMSNESGSNFGPNGLGYLVASRLMWNPKADVDAICRDFYEKAFGPAAEHMKRYYERFDGGVKPMLSDHLMALAHRDVAEASKLAAKRPDVLARLDDVKLYLYYVRLMRELTVSEREERLKCLYPVLNFAYRARHRYIVNSAAVRGRYQTYYLRGIEQPPEWDYRKMGSKTAWYSGDDYTHEEVEKLFREGLRMFKAQDFEERQFSDQLVYGSFKPVPKGRRARLRFQNPEEFVMQSLAGGPLEFKLQTGVIAHYRDRRPTQWKVADSEGKEISQGELPLDGELHSIEVKVAGPGTYHLHVNDFGAGWGIDYAPGKPYVWKLEKGKNIHTMGWTLALYFYVPKGGKTVAYYVSGNAHTVIDANGEEVAKVPKQAGNVITITVPEGRDGQVWHLKNLGLGKLWFYNCPNYIGAGSEDMLIPKEAAGE